MIPENSDPFTEIRFWLDSFKPADLESVKKTHHREAELTKPAGSLGRLEEISAWFFGFRHQYPASIENVKTLIFAGNHGITQKNISAFPANVTKQMVTNFQNGGAAINQLCQIHGSILKIIPLWLDHPTKDFSENPAMSYEKCLEAIKIGFASVGRDCDILCLGEMGIGNTSVAAALCWALFGGDASLWVGRGTGLDDAGVARKTQIIKKAYLLHEKTIKEGNPFKILCRLGGYEIAAIVGAIIAARLNHIPVLLDGYVCCAAAAIIDRAKEGGLDHCLCGHVSAEYGHRKLLHKLQMKALLDMNMRLGEGSGAVLALPLIRSALSCHNGMARFDDAHITKKKPSESEPPKLN